LRPVVGIACNRATRERFVAAVDLQRLEKVASIEFLDFDGPDRADGPPDPGRRARLLDFVPGLTALVISHGCPRIDAEILAAAPGLRMVGDLHGDRFADRIDVDACAAAGVSAVDTTHASSDPVAEWALGLTLIGLRNAGALFRRLIDGELLWPDRTVFTDDPGYLHGELTGKTVGLIGLGHIGRLLVEFLRPFRADVVAFDPHVPPLVAETLDVDLMPLDTLLATADVVICLVPLTASTAGLLGAAEFALLKPGAVFVNVSRGAVVRTDALIDRLRRGDVIACLDVVDPEPLAVDSPLRDLPNVFLTPHIAGVTEAAEPRFFAYMTDEVLRLLRGRRPRAALVVRHRP
jgi:phosphoglycerate dehydrogenase-like enzyme